MKAPELPALTGLRFLAATCVFLSHGSLNGELVHINLGNFGVSVFFVLSGFILTYNYAGLFTSGVNWGNYGRFIWDRLAKIYPLYLLTLLLSIPIELLGHHRIWSWGALLLQLAMLQCILPFDHLRATDHFNVPGWSISCEFFFYLLTPFLIWFGLSAKRPVRAILTTVATAIVLAVMMGKWAVETSSWPPRFAPARLSEFLTGVAAAIFLLKGGVPSKSVTTMAVMAGITLLGLSLWCNDQVPFIFRLGVLNAPGAALFIYGLAHGRGWIAQCLSHRWLLLLGGASFAFYLTHDLIIRVCRGVFTYYDIPVATIFATLSVALLMFLVTQMVSIFLFRKFEAPFQKFLRGLVRRNIPGDVVRPTPASAATGD